MAPNHWEPPEPFDDDPPMDALFGIITLVLVIVIIRVFYA